MGELQADRHGRCQVTLGVFQSQVDRLRVLRFAPADFNSHWEALHDIPDELFTAAVSHALRTRAEFPAPAELRADTDAVIRRQQPIAEHPTSRRVPIEGGIPVTIRNPFAETPGQGDLHLTITETIQHACDECDDTGRVTFWCGEDNRARRPWIYRRACDRRNPHGPHDWVAACPCVETNPVILARKAAQQQRFAQEPEKVGR